MYSNCKYFGSILLTFLLYSIAVSYSYPALKNADNCKTLPNLYPPNFNLNDTLNSCNSKNLTDPLSIYCSELSLVLSEISLCGLGSLLKDVSSDAPVYIKIFSQSQEFLVTENQKICEVFKNSSLYKVYLDEPGFAKQLTGPLCTLFCREAVHNYCETLLRTYWIKKVLLDFKDVIKQGNSETDPKEATKQANTKSVSDTSKKTTIPVPQTEQLKKKSDVNPSGSGSSVINAPGTEHAKKNSKPEPDNQDLKNHGHSPPSDTIEQSKSGNILPKEPKSEPELPGGIANQKDANDNAKKPKSDVKLPTADGNIPSDIHKTTLDLNHLNTAGPKSNQNNQKESSDLKIKQETHLEKPDDSGKSKIDHHDADEDPNLKVKPSNPINDATEKKESLPSPITQPENDKKEGNDKDDGNNNLDGQIPVVPDKATSDDTATNLDPDTELGNQMRDFGDGYAANEYQDAGPPEAEMPLTDENVPAVTKDDSKNLQPDETNVDKQVHDVPQLSAFPEEEDSHFFAYFLTIVVFCIAGYLVFHNKQKIFALIIEGRHERRRRPNNGTYKRLDSKDGAKATSHVIF